MSKINTFKRYVLVGIDEVDKTPLELIKTMNTGGMNHSYEFWNYEDTYWVKFKEESFKLSENSYTASRDKKTIFKIEDNNIIVGFQNASE